MLTRAVSAVVNIYKKNCIYLIDADTCESKLNKKTDIKLSLYFYIEESVISELKESKYSLTYIRFSEKC